MNTPSKHYLRVPAVIAGLAIATTALAQDDGSDSADVFELDPFEVSPERDEGFVATSSLAGGRLASELRNTPAAYSVQTREFIDALSLTNLEDALEWTVNATSVEEEGRLAIFGNSDQTLSIRGITAPGRQRNFFPLNISFDSYNLDRYDYSRGPNAILFGTGSFAGTPNVVTKRAQLAENFGRFDVQIGSWDQYRTTFDYNYVVNEKLAVRTNLLWQDSDSWRRFQSDDRMAGTLALTWQIAENTSLMLEAETGDYEINKPFSMFSDKFTGWDGSTVFDELMTNSTTPGNSTNRTNGVIRMGSDTNPFLTFVPQYGGNILNYGDTMTTIGGGRYSQTGIGGHEIPAGAPSIQHRDRPIIGIDNLYPGRFDAAVAGSAFEVPDPSFVISTEVPTLVQDYDTYSGFLRHKVGEDLHFEVALNVAEESRETNYLNGRDLDEVFIDINSVIPTGEDPNDPNFSGGAENPMYLQPYSHGRRARGLFGTEYTNGRVAMAYDVPDNEFGRFIFSAMGGFTDLKYRKRIESYRLLATEDPREWANQEQVWYRYYWYNGDYSLPDVDQAVINGETIPVGWVGDGARPQDISKVHTEYQYLQTALNGAFLNDKLHVILALRYDDLSISQDYNLDYSDYPEDWDGVTTYYRAPAPANFLDLDEDEQSLYSPPDVNLKETTYSAGVVYHITDNFSVMGNYATGFNPPAGETRLRLDGTIMPTPVSKGWDAGFRFSFLDNKVQATLTRYEAEETAQPFGISFANHFQTIHNANVVGDLSPEGINQRGFPLVPRQPFDQRDLSAEGFEFEVVANVTKNLRLSANAALADANAVNAYQDTLAFLGEWGDIMELAVTDSGAYIGSDGAAYVDESIEEDLRPDSNAAVTAFNQIYFNYLPNIGTEAGRDQTLLGLTEVSANFYADYEFKDGALDGFSVGVGANYRGDKVVGFRGLDTIQDPASPNDPTAAIDDPDVDEYTPAYSDPYWLATLTFGYKMKLSDNLDLRLRLRVKNLFDEDSPVYGTRTHQMPPNGDFENTAARVATPTRFRWQTPREYNLTASFLF